MPLTIIYSANKTGQEACERKLSDESKMTRMSKVNVIVAEDHPMVREALVLAVNNAPGFNVCGEADSHPGLSQMLQDIPANCLVLDIYLNGVSMLDHIPDIVKRYVDLKVLAISAHDDELHAFHALRGGAHGFVSKAAAAGEFVQALLAIQGNGHYLPANMKTNVVGRLLSKKTGNGRTPQDKLFALTVKEMEVFHLLGEWKNTAEIADLMGISTKTVEIHRIHIKGKLGCNTLAELKRSAVGWVRKPRPPL